MDLVIATKLAHKRSINEESISLYEKHMARYLEGMLFLYKADSLTPNHHLSLHFGDHMRRFGPTQHTRAFAPERQIQTLERIPTNMRFGESDNNVSTMSPHVFARPARKYDVYHILCPTEPASPSHKRLSAQRI